MKNQIGFCLLLLTLTINLPVTADSHGNFPGKGSRESFNKAVIIVNEGVDLSHKKDYGRAIACYKKALSVYPYDSVIYQNIGFALKELNRFDEAIPYYQKALALEPDYLSALLGCGESLWYLKNLAEAEKYYRKAVTVKPDSYEAVGSLGDLLRERGKFKEARSWLVRAKSCPKCKDFPGEIEEALKRCDKEEKLSQMKEASH